MNLHVIVTAAINSVNPFAIGSVRVSNGAYTKTADYKRVPKYTQTDGVPLQIQPLTTKDLRFLDGLNVQGTERAVYLNGSLLGIQRLGQKGGDLLCFDGAVWLTTAVIETWRTGWCKVGVTLQMDEPWPSAGEFGVTFETIPITFNGEVVTYDETIVAFEGNPIAYQGELIMYEGV